MRQPIFSKIVRAGLAPAQMVFISKLNGRGTARRAPTDTMMDISTINREQFGKPVSSSIPTIILAIKSAVTKRIN